MAPNKTDKPAVASFEDHEVITPPHKLRRAVTKAGAGDDPVARAEAALARLSSEFAEWMHAECEKLDQMRNQVRRAGMGVQQREALFRVAHDIKGQAVTFGFPLAGEVAGSLCRLIEETRDPRRIPLALVDQHVDAVRAIMRERNRPNADSVAERLTFSLCEAADEFLHREGTEGEPAVPSPPLTPEK